jgi:Na+/H+ antiporter NhaD/arsenite permease-like protein
VRVIAEIDHEVIVAAIGAMAVIGAAFTTGMFAYLAAKFRNGKAEVDRRLDIVEREIEAHHPELTRKGDA